MAKYLITSNYTASVFIPLNSTSIPTSATKSFTKNDTIDATVQIGTDNTNHVVTTDNYDITSVAQLVPDTTTTPVVDVTQLSDDSLRQLIDISVSPSTSMELRKAAIVELGNRLKSKVRRVSIVKGLMLLALILLIIFLIKGIFSSN